MRVNWIRFTIGGLVAAIIMFFADGFFHEKVVAADWAAVYANLGVARPAEEHSLALVYFAIFELGRGFVAMLLYILMRPCCNPGPKTAAWAGFIIWVAFSVTGPAQFIPLGFFSNTLWIKVGAFHLVTSIVAAIVGAAIYKDAATPAVQAG